MSAYHLTFSFVIPAYNSKNELIKCIKSINQLNYNKSNYEIIVIDDGSSNNTLRELKRINLNNLVVLKTKRLGAAHARNVGIRKAKNEIIIFLDQDVLVNKDILTVYEKAFKAWGVEIIQGNIWKQCRTCKMAKIHAKWRRSAFIDKVTTKGGLLTTFVTRNVAIKKSLLERFSKKGNCLFNERILGTGGEDRELGYRLTRYGARIRLEENAIASHKDPVTLRGILLQKYRHAVGDAKLGINERFYDLSNFKRVALNPLKVGVPLYFSLLIWIFYIIGSELELLKQKFSRESSCSLTRNHYPRGL